MNVTYYIEGLLRQPSPALARRYLGLGDTDSVTFGYVTNTTPLWNDVRIPMSATSAGVANPAVIAEIVPASDIGTWRFSNVVDQSVNFEIQVPHGVNPNYPLRLHLHWTARTPATNVDWGVTIISAAIGASFGNPPAPATTVVTDSTTLNYEHKVTPIVQVPIVGESQVIAGRLFRDTPDGFADFVYGLSLDAHYVVQRAGSLDEF